MCLLTALAILVVILVMYMIWKRRRDSVTSEGFWGDSGQFCFTCNAKKTINECLLCYNCGWGVDRYGNGSCMGGSVHGPNNYEDISRWNHEGSINPNEIVYWRHNDPYSYMIQRNQNYKCSMGPRSSNRIIGV